MSCARCTRAAAELTRVGVTLLLAGGEVSLQTCVWTTGMVAWVPISELDIRFIVEVPVEEAPLPPPAPAPLFITPLLPPAPAPRSIAAPVAAPVVAPAPGGRARPCACASL